MRRLLMALIVMFFACCSQNKDNSEWLGEMPSKPGSGVYVEIYADIVVPYHGWFTSLYGGVADDVWDSSTPSSRWVHGCGSSTLTITSKTSDELCVRATPKWDALTYNMCGHDVIIEIYVPGDCSE